MVTTYCKASSTQKQSIEGIDWSEIDALCQTLGKTLPRNSVTSKMIQDRHGCSESHARKIRRSLVASGKFEEGSYHNGKSVVKYIVPVNSSKSEMGGEK